MPKFRHLLNRLSDIKTRTLLILVAIVVIVIVGMVFITGRESKPPEVAAEVKAARIGDIASLPGTGAYNEEYAKLQLAENERLANAAQKTGEAAIPRLINPQTEEQARLSFGQEFCAECVYDQQGYDQNGYDAKGYNQAGYNKEGYDAAGYDEAGYDKDGYDKDGYDRNGCNRDGLDKNGMPCYDATGYNAQGYDKLGYDKDGFDKNGCNRQGIDRNGKVCFNEAGYDKQGFDKDGFNKAGFDKDGYDRDGFDKNGCNREGFDRNGQPCNGINLPVANTPQDAEAAYRKLLEDQQKAREAQQKAELEAQNREHYLAEQQAMQQAFEALLQNQSMSVVAKWQPPTQMYVRGAALPTAIGAEGAAGAGGPGSTTPGTVLYKAGSIIFAVLDTTLNSDEPGPVLATIVEGPFQGSKVMGDLQLVEDKLMLRFSLLSSPDLPRSIPFQAVAIDGETARTALSTGVDNHYFLRYGSLFASAFLEGIGEAILAGITQPVLEVDNEVLVVQSADVTVGQALLVGAGTVGQKWGEHLGEIFDKPPTVTVDSGTGIGLLLMQDLVIDEAGGAVPAIVPQTAEVVPATLPQGNQQASPTTQVR